MLVRSLFITGMIVVFSSASLAHFAEEDMDETGVHNPTDFSWRSYLDRMDRFPERIGIVCYNAYILHKTDDYTGVLKFLKECAERGIPASMIYLSTFHEKGRGTPKSPERATEWLKRAADLNYAPGQFHYGVALLRGHGVKKNIVEGKRWVRKAAEQGDESARILIEEDYDLSVVTSSDPTK